MITVDLTYLDDAQLAFLSTIDPDAVNEERLRRKAYPDLEEGYSALAQAHLDMLQEIANHRKTAAMKSILGTRITEVLDRLFVTLRREGIAFDEPSLGATADES